MAHVPLRGAPDAPALAEVDIAAEPPLDDVAPSLLLPELAQLQHLQVLHVVLPTLRLRDPVPPTWTALGAFPRLKA